MMKIHVLYFGGLREKFGGTRREEVEVDDAATVRALVDELCARRPALELHRRHIKTAVNDEFASLDHVLSGGDVVAIMPPFAGGAERYCRLTDCPLDVGEVLASVTGAGQGGVVLFIGFVRDHNDGHDVTRLDYEANPALVLRTFTDIVRHCESTAERVRVGIAHRTGTLQIGDLAVIVAASAPHRTEAFYAARLCIDLLKKEAPIWKKEYSLAGEDWIGLRP